MVQPWVSCEEKLDLLDRMYAVAHPHLGRKDERTYVSMRQELLHRIRTVQAARKPVGQLQDRKEGFSDRLPAVATPEIESHALESAELGPEEVVRLFVSCWDSRDFLTEFSLLSPDFLRAEGASTELRAYVKQRMAKYSARLLKGQIAKGLETICGCQVTGSHAVVDCVEIRQWHTSKAAQRRRYHLQHYPEGWLIDYFEDVAK